MPRTDHVALIRRHKMTYVAGAPGHVDDKDGNAKQEEDNGEDKDHPRTQGEVHLQT